MEDDVKCFFDKLIESAHKELRPPSQKDVYIALSRKNYLLAKFRGYIIISDLKIPVNIRKEGDKIYDINTGLRIVAYNQDFNIKL